jgi:hypothetical protein
MADKKQKAPKFVSPKGVAIFPWLDKPDTKFKAEGEYRVKLRMPAEAAAPLIEKLEAIRQAAIKEASKDPKRKGKKVKEQDPPWSNVTDDDGNETGDVEFNFKRTASGVSKKTGQPWAIKPDLFGSDGEALPADVRIFGGSVLKIAFSVTSYDTAAAGVGVKLNLDGVKVLKLVESSRSAESYGFGDDTDDDDTDTSTDEGTAGAGADGDNEDF